jgi:hypothetical protein
MRFGEPGRLIQTVERKFLRVWVLQIILVEGDYHWVRFLGNLWVGVGIRVTRLLEVLFVLTGFDFE